MIVLLPDAKKCLCEEGIDETISLCQGLLHQSVD